MTPQFDLNKAVYHARGISRSYRETTLEPVESIVLLRYQPSFVGRNVLDIGVGTGRTIDYLRPLARRYVCIDYSPEMVEAVRASWPDVEVQPADMRDLSTWSDGAFDFVFATNNVLDAVSHQDRIKTLNEVWRVLSSGGTFIFSSHNRAYSLAQSGPQLSYSRNPVTQMVLVIQYLRQQLNHWHVAPYRRFEQDYALLNDRGHDYALLHYYVNCDAQRRQLHETGFELIDVFDTGGRRLLNGGDDSSAPWLMYVARRP